jgi:1,4-dihydroxy-2-naphthoate octaprenyltransferase
MKAAAAMLALATLLAVPLLIYRGWPIIAIGIPSLWFCYGYTGGPMPLAYRGLGELFVVLFFGLVAVTGSAFVQSGHWHFEAIIAGLQVGMLSTVLIAINNLRDIEEDTKTGKRTLAVRFGKRFAKWEIQALNVIPLVIGFYWMFSKWWLNVVLFTTAPLAIIGFHIDDGIRRNAPSRAYNRYLALGGINLIIFAVLFGLALSVNDLGGYLLAILFQLLMGDAD